MLSAIATECDLNKHVYTQAPYALLCAFWAIIVGTIPVGLRYDSDGGYSQGVAILMGLIVIIVSALGLGAPAVSASGRMGIVDELYMKLNPRSPLHELKRLTIEFHATGKAPHAPVEETDNGEAHRVADEADEADGSDDNQADMDVDLDAKAEDKPVVQV